MALPMAACGDDDGGSTTTDAGPREDGSIGLDGTTPTPPTPPPGDGGPTPTDGSPTPTDGGDGATPPAGMSRIERACGPADGPALRLTVARGGPRCEPDTTNEHLLFFIYGGLPIEVPETITLGMDTGIAQRCMPDADATTCVDATGGTITFDAFMEDVSASGTFAIDVGGEHLEGFFSAVFCGEPPLCG